MNFNTDKQTLNDLNIFGRPGANSVFDLFNRTTTRGGAEILGEMFRYPLADEKHINRRISIISYFAAAQQKFPFAVEDLDAAESYLANTDERTKLSAQEQSMVRQLSNLVAADADTVTLHHGIYAILKLLKTVQGFIAAINIEDKHAYAEERKLIADLLATPAFESVWKQPEGKLSTVRFAEYDAIFRFGYRKVLLEILRSLYHVDVYITVSKVALENNFIFPKALPDAPLLVKLDGLYHPQVKNAVPNSLLITPDSNVIFLTGANMAGKSTFMKSLSTALFLAHMGFPVAAREMEFSVMEGIYTTINLPDDLGMGASHFYAEVLRAKKITEELKQGKRLFIVFDELFRGTNVKDAGEATIALTAAFAGRKDSMFVISTHIIEAGVVLKERCSNIRFIYLPTHMEGNYPVYTYKLAEGITTDRHGMIIINNEGILEMLKAGLKKQ